MRPIGIKRAVFNEAMSLHAGTVTQTLDIEKTPRYSMMWTGDVLLISRQDKDGNPVPGTTIVPMSAVQKLYSLTPMHEVVETVAPEFFLKPAAKASAAKGKAGG